MCPGLSACGLPALPFPAVAPLEANHPPLVVAGQKRSRRQDEERRTHQRLDAASATSATSAADTADNADGAFFHDRRDLKKMLEVRLSLLPAQPYPDLPHRSPHLASLSRGLCCACAVLAAPVVALPLSSPTSRPQTRIPQPAIRSHPSAPSPRLRCDSTAYLALFEARCRGIYPSRKSYPDTILLDRYLAPAAPCSENELPQDKVFLTPRRSVAPRDILAREEPCPPSEPAQPPPPFPSPPSVPASHSQRRGFYAISLKLLLGRLWP